MLLLKSFRDSQAEAGMSSEERKMSIIKAKMACAALMDSINKAKRTLHHRIALREFTSDTTAILADSLVRALRPNGDG